ncbi:MAG: acetyltransferase, family [Haloplasmataceae bacterium]|nr:acetyltransferase, family [Haloplasmataceae bacterium]
MIDDWKNHNEKPKPWTINIENDNLPLLIQKLADFSNGIGLIGKQVENTTYWLVNHERVIGAVNIRHRLNDYLLKFDGHIGFGIRPSERCKGYATIMLALALEKTKTMGMDKILITCNKGNIASEKTIIKNGGVFESEETEINGNIVRRFWIKTDLIKGDMMNGY